EIDVYEPLAVKKQVIKSATEAATMILKIDDVIAAGKTKTPKTPKESKETESKEFD
ncbi:MAG: thermosome subunit, partial [Candidatus Bathyarchaeia archaeon]